MSILGIHLEIIQLEITLVDNRLTHVAAKDDELGNSDDIGVFGREKGLEVLEAVHIEPVLELGEEIELTEQFPRHIQLLQQSLFVFDVKKPQAEQFISRGFKLVLNFQRKTQASDCVPVCTGQLSFV